MKIKKLPTKKQEVARKRNWDKARVSNIYSTAYSLAMCARSKGEATKLKLIASLADNILHDWNK